MQADSYKHYRKKPIIISLIKMRCIDYSFLADAMAKVIVLKTMMSTIACFALTMNLLATMRSAFRRIGYAISLTIAVIIQMKKIATVVKRPSWNLPNVMNSNVLSALACRTAKYAMGIEIAQMVATKMGNVVCS